MIEEQMDEESVVTFPYIPELGPGKGTLMPRTGGMVGVEYAQVCTHHIVKAKRDGWGPVRDSEPYVIAGPEGEAEVVLLCKGEPVKGASPMAGARVCRLDREIFTLTGFEDPDAAEEEVDTEDAEGKSEGTESPLGIQAREPSV